MSFEIRCNFEGQNLRTFETARKAMEWGEDIENQGGTIIWIKRDGKRIEPSELRDLAADEPS